MQSLWLEKLCNTHKSSEVNIGVVSNQGVIKFSQEAWLKLYIDMNTELRKEAKKILRGTFSI